MFWHVNFIAPPNGCSWNQNCCWPKVCFSVSAMDSLSVSKSLNKVHIVVATFTNRYCWSCDSANIYILISLYKLTDLIRLLNWCKPCQFRLERTQLKLTKGHWQSWERKSNANFRNLFVRSGGVQRSFVERKKICLTSMENQSRNCSWFAMEREILRYYV